MACCEQEVLIKSVDRVSSLLHLSQITLSHYEGSEEEEGSRSERVQYLVIEGLENKALQMFAVTN